MEDVNVNEKPYKKGDKIVLEITITDEDKSFDFIAKSILGKNNSKEELGFIVDKVSFWKDRYIDNISLELRQEIVDKLQKSINEIRELTGIL